MKASPSSVTATSAAVPGRNAVNTPAIPAGTRRSPAYQSSRHSTLAVREWNTSSEAMRGSASAIAAPMSGSAKGASTSAENPCIHRLAVITGTRPAMRRASST